MGERLPYCGRNSKTFSIFLKKWRVLFHDPSFAFGCWLVKAVDDLSLELPEHLKSIGVALQRTLPTLGPMYRPHNSQRLRNRLFLFLFCLYIYIYIYMCFMFVICVYFIFICCCSLILLFSLSLLFFSYFSNSCFFMGSPTGREGRSKLT